MAALLAMARRYWTGAPGARRWFPWTQRRAWHGAADTFRTGMRAVIVAALAFCVIVAAPLALALGLAR